MLSNISDIQRVSYNMQEEKMDYCYTTEDRTVIQPLSSGKINSFTSVIGYDNMRFKSFVFIDSNGKQIEFNNISYKQIKDYINSSFSKQSESIYVDIDNSYLSESSYITVDQVENKDYSWVMVIIMYCLTFFLIFAIKLDYMYRYEADYIQDKYLSNRLLVINS